MRRGAIPWGSLLVFIFHLLSASAARADSTGPISGSFRLDLALEPQTTSRQWTEFDLDLEALLRLDLPLRDLAIRNDLALGIAGLEHYILAFDTTISFLTLRDELWFAIPYSRSRERLSPNPSFVGNRLQALMKLEELTLDLLALLEDIHFNHPYPGPVQSPDYRFGLSLGLIWKAPRGPRLRMKMNICVEDAIARVKKYSALGRVCREGGFTSETIELTGLALGGPFTLDSRLTFRRDEPLKGLFGLRAALSPQLEARLIFTSEDLAPLVPLPFPSPVISSLTTLYTVMLQLPGWEQLILALIDQNGDLFPSDGDPFLAYATIGLQESKIRLLVLARLGQGLEHSLLGLSLPLPKVAGYLDVESNFSREDDIFKASSWSFALSGGIAGLELRSELEFELSGLRRLEFSVGLAF